jgi:hypothetical protein
MLLLLTSYHIFVLWMSNKCFSVKMNSMKVSIWELFKCGYDCQGS